MTLTARTCHNFGEEEVYADVVSDDNDRLNFIYCSI